MPDCSDIETVLLDTFKVCNFTPSGTDWNERETIAHSQVSSSLEQLYGTSVARSSVYLGGDSIRPYLLLDHDKYTLLISNHQRQLSIPGLISEIESCTFGPFQRSRKQSEQGLTYELRTLPTCELLSRRLQVPRVHLVSLTNACRYQTRRYPLNVGRLAQWLRFQHVARVSVIDLALNCGGDIPTLSQALISASPDVIGISVNFGELESLREVISQIRASKLRPTMCLGNVLAAWELKEMEEICSGFDINISKSYGELDLEEVCRNFTVQRGKSLTGCKPKDNVKVRNSSFPGSIVFPDERLVTDTLSTGGQISIETSFGCQYGLCTFCPRDHRGKGWQRPHADAAAVVRGLSSLVKNLCPESSRVLSIVDEEAFGAEGLTSGLDSPSIIDVVNIAATFGVNCEIYTRAEQIFDRRKTESESISRLSHLYIIAKSLSRVFVGVESGSDSQLRRYGKGQTAQQVVDALRAGSALGLPLEFGFITFDPLLTQQELLENLQFLARTDVLLKATSETSPDKIYSLVSSGLIGGAAGEPLYSRVAYMATELELLSQSSYARQVLKSHRELIASYDSSFARYTYAYKDGVISPIADWSRVWTEGTFEPIYKLRLAARSVKHATETGHTIVRRYREATFALLVGLASYYSDYIRASLQRLGNPLRTSVSVDLCRRKIDIGILTDLWQWVIADSTYSDSNKAHFSLHTLNRRRAA